MTHRSKSSHIGSCLSICEILYCLYFKVMNIDPHDPHKIDRDKFILSKGHGSAALYATLAERGFFPKDKLEGFYMDHGTLPGHLDMQAVDGIEASAGSLGHGLSLGLGMAIANKCDSNPGRIFVLLGDGECNEGSVWEGAMFAPMRQLDNLTVMVDFNKWQATDRSTKVLALEPLTDKWKSFGWEVFEADGHDFAKLKTMLEAASKVKNKPSVIVCHTTKGKGISFMEDNNNWHYRVPNEEEMAISKVELGIK